MIYRGTTTELILKLLLYKTYSYKDVERMVRKRARHNNISSASIQSTLSRLKKKKLITKTNTGWSANQLAVKILKNRSEFNNQKSPTTKKKHGDKMIVMYDIPENLKQQRNRLRDGLKILDFVKKQQSVWIGPAPLPKEFIDFLNELGVLQYLNFFQVKEEDVV